MIEKWAHFGGFWRSLSQFKLAMRMLFPKQIPRREATIQLKSLSRMLY